MQPENLSRFGQVLLNQGLIEDVLLRYINETGRVKVEWSKRAETLDLSSNDSEYPVTVKVKDVADSSMSMFLASERRADLLYKNRNYPCTLRSWLRRFPRLDKGTTSCPHGDSLGGINLGSHRHCTHNQFPYSSQPFLRPMSNEAVQPTSDSPAPSSLRSVVVS